MCQQIAANHKGSQLLHTLVGEYTLPVVHGYMSYIQKCASQLPGKTWLISQKCGASGPEYADRVREVSRE
jgi:N-methylhydantoinase B/oxoprolinase/acetone carboxylase alpha subunit